MVTGPRVHGTAGPNLTVSDLVEATSKVRTYGPAWVPPTSPGQGDAANEDHAVLLVHRLAAAARPALRSRDLAHRPCGHADSAPCSLHRCQPFPGELDERVQFARLAKLPFRPDLFVTKQLL